MYNYIFFPVFPVRAQRDCVGGLARSSRFIGYANEWKCQYAIEFNGALDSRDVYRFISDS